MKKLPTLKTSFSLNHDKKNLLLFFNNKSNSISSNRIKKKLIINNKCNNLRKNLNIQNNILFKKNFTKIDIFRNNRKETQYGNDLLSNTNLNSNNRFNSFKENEPHFFYGHFKNGIDSYQNIHDKYILFKDKNNLYSLSYTNNSFSSDIHNSIFRVKDKINNLKKNRTFLLKQKQNKNKGLYFNKSKKEDVNENSKNRNDTTEKLSIYTIKIEDGYKKRDLNLERFNKIFSKYISNNIIHRLNGFNRIKHLVELKGLCLDKSKVYNEKNKNISNNNIFNQKLYNIKKLNKNKIVYDYDFIETIDKVDFNTNKERYPIITKINKNKLRNLLKINRDDDDKNNNINSNNNNFNDNKNINEEYINYIKNEVNKYYKNKQFSSINDFYKEWIKENKKYITCNDIYFYLNKIIKIDKPINKEEIINIFFNNNNLNELDFNNFKIFFFGKTEIDKTEDTNNKINEIKEEKEVSKNNKINAIKDNKGILYIDIIKKIKEKKEILINKMKNRYELNYKEFYDLINSNIIIESKYYFNEVIKKIYFEYYNKDKNIINLLYFLEKISNDNINSHKKLCLKDKSNMCSNNSINKYNDNNINQQKINNIKDDIKLKEKKLIYNYSDKYKNIFKSKKYGLEIFEKNKKIENEKKNKIKNNNDEIKKNNNDDIKSNTISNIQNDSKNKLNNKLNFKFSEKKFLSRKKEKNSDIINLI